MMLYNCCILLVYGYFINVDSAMSHNFKQDQKQFNCANGTLLSSVVCIPEGYLKGEVPKTPTVVKTSIEINNILEVNDKKMRITLDFYQELTWMDNRIKTNVLYFDDE